jgi:hypothetical protein
MHLSQKTGGKKRHEFAKKITVGGGGGGGGGFRVIEGRTWVATSQSLYKE